MKNLILISAAVLLAACAMPQGGMKRGGSPFVEPETGPFVEENIEVITAPAGAQVLVNDGFMGYAPVKAVVRRYWRGEPGNMVLDQVKIEAQPIAAGHCAQGGYFGAGSSKVPAPVRFNMTACAAQPAGKK
ncbi:MAG: hypothetical protein A2081_03575 [Elusimicrobia bacterium GWC2_61_19]|nr:MAG: hypothetical protein A2081_03575 [Elusimicrobia bacterium GWC2_61_19]